MVERVCSAPAMVAPMPPRLIELRAEPLSIPLVDPFVIATGRVDSTRSVLVTALVQSEDGYVTAGLGEASCLPPVTREDQPDALAAVKAAAPQLAGMELTLLSLRALGAGLDAFPVARSGVEMALLDALARVNQVPLYTLLGGPAPGQAADVVTDITLPILAPERMGALAQQWWSQGFRVFKVKVGRALEEDRAALEAIARATPDAVLRLDANAGWSAAQALEGLRIARSLGFTVECFEQPCPPDALDQLAEVAHHTHVPVVADESVKRQPDLDKVLALEAAGGINLKLAKSGGLLPALELGRAARSAGMKLMVGGMVETRLGMTAATHLVAALGGVEFADLDTAWLLRRDPFQGGYQADGPRYALGAEPGLGVSQR